MTGNIGVPEMALFVATVSLAYTVRGIAGFGSGLIAIPLLALTMPVVVAVPLVALLDYIASAGHGLRYRKAIVWRDLLPLLPFAILGMLAALAAFHSVDADVLRKALGLFVLCFAIYSFFPLKPESTVTRIWAVPAGAFGGLVGTLFGTGGPFYVLYLRFRGLDKTRFRATFATLFLLDGAARISGYAVSGFLDRELLVMFGLALPFMAAGLYAGGRIHVGMTQQAFQRSISVLLIISAVLLLIR